MDEKQPLWRIQKYWNERSVILNENLLSIGDDYYKQLALEFERAEGRIEKEIESFYSRFAVENKMTYAQAKRVLTTDEKLRYTMELTEYIEKAKDFPYSDKWAAALENASTAHRVTRLQSLQMQMGQQVEELYGKYNNGMAETAEKVFTEGYYRSIYEEQKSYGQGSPFATLDTETVKNVIAKPWTPDGSNFSEKIWKDRDGLMDYLHRELAQAFIRGEGPARMIKEIKKKFGVSSKNAARLVQTESAYFSAKARIENYKALGYKKYMVLAVIDSATSQVCRDMNNAVFDIDDFMPGVTANPFHPRCRSTTAPHVSVGKKEKTFKVVRDGETGFMYAVPESMGYEDWKKQHVDDKAVDTNISDKPVVENNEEDTLLMPTDNKIKDSSKEYSFNYKKKSSNVAWNEIIDVDKEISKILNNIHTDLNYHIIDNHTEKIYLLNTSKGSDVISQIGTSSDEVELSKDVLNVLKKGKDNDIIMSHCHPSKTSFSVHDIRKIIEFPSIKALTVECVDGSKYLLDRGTMKSSLLTKHFFLSKYDSIYWRVAQSYPELNDEKEMHKVWDKFINEVNKSVAEHYGMIYEKVE